MLYIFRNLEYYLRSYDFSIKSNRVIVSLIVKMVERKRKKAVVVIIIIITIIRLFIIMKQHTLYIYIYIDTNIDSIYFKRNKNIKVIIDSTHILLTYSNFEVLVDF